MKRRSAVEELLNDFVDSVRDKQEDIGKTIDDYTSNFSPKPNMDVVEDDENITVVSDLPGYEKENIKIDITEDSIEITARQEEEIDIEGRRYVRQERVCGELNRIVSLPAKVQIHESSAKFENGILTVVMPKLDKNPRFKVEVD